MEEKYFALIRNNLIESIIVATLDFIPVIEKDYQFIIEVDKVDRPNVGDSYYPDTKSFISNNTIFSDIPVEIDVTHLKTGTETGFEPFNLSKYSITYENKIVTIGCKQYPALGLLDTLHKLLIQKQKTTTYFTSTPEGPMHGKFGVTWDDAKIIYDKLSKVKL